MGRYPYIQARHYHPGRLRPVRLIVIHTMESPEKPGTARAVARWFAGENAPQASAHYCIDSAEVVQGVEDGDTAWAAPGANADGLQLEHAGIAAQTAAGWRDAYSRAVLARSAGLAARLADLFDIPVRHLTDAEMAAGKAGFVGHDQVSRVYRRSNHTDPGPAFPWPEYLHLVTGGQSATPVEDTMLTDAELDALADRTADKVLARFAGWIPPSTGESEAPPNWQTVVGRTYSGVNEIIRRMSVGSPVLLTKAQIDAIADGVAARLPAGQAGDPRAVMAALRDALDRALGHA